jgi:molybdate transport system ATP-binding protein
MSSYDLTPPLVGLSLIVGANGSGKSTAARHLALSVPGAELLSAESQQAFYEDQLARDESNFNQGIDTSVTLGKLVGEAARTHPLVTALRLEAIWNRGYRLLSTGEGRKALLLRAVLRDPPLLVLDEPFDGLDVAAREELARAIEAVAERVPVVVVGTMRADHLPFDPARVSQVNAIEQRRLVFSGSVEAWRARSTTAREVHLPPPVHLGSFYDPVDANVPLIVLRQGRVAYGDHVVFEELDFTVHPGEHTLIEGPNGSGKSTLLELFTGDHPQAYSNDLHLFGRKRGSGETVWDIKKNVGLVSGQLHRNYRVGGSVEEVLVSGLFDSIGVYRETEPSHRARAKAWLEWLAIEATLGTPFRELSYGQQRLVLIARAAIKVPRLLVLDEPTSGLDAENRERVHVLVRSLCTQQLSTVLMVTHLDEEQTFWAERIGGARLVMGRAKTSSHELTT